MISISPSSLGMLRRCPRQFYFHYLLSKQQIEPQLQSLLRRLKAVTGREAFFGTLVHNGILEQNTRIRDGKTPHSLEVLVGRATELSRLERDRSRVRAWALREMIASSGLSEERELLGACLSNRTEEAWSIIFRMLTTVPQVREPHPIGNIPAFPNLTQEETEAILFGYLEGDPRDKVLLLEDLLQVEAPDPAWKLRKAANIVADWAEDWKALEKLIEICFRRYLDSSHYQELLELDPSRFLLVDPELSESDFELTIGEATIRARPDLAIARNDGTIEVTDYKTGRDMFRPDEEEEDDEPSQDLTVHEALQGGINLGIAVRHFRAEISKTRFRYFNLQSGREVFIRGSEELLLDVEAQILAALRDLESRQVNGKPVSNNFPILHPAQSWKCRRCSYQFFCPAGANPVLSDREKWRPAKRQWME